MKTLAATLVIVCLLPCARIFAESQGESTCAHLQEYSEMPGSPFVFDQKTQEFQIQYKDDKGAKISLMIRYCPFCGAKAPEGIRDSLFHAVSSDENSRLNNLFEGLLTYDAVKAKHGEPDTWTDTTETDSIHTTFDQMASQPTPKVRSYKTAVYSHLSDDADVRLMLNGDNTIHGITVMPKQK